MATEKIPTEGSVLKRYLHGSGWAAHLAAKGNKGGGGKSSGKSRRKVLYPPLGGWK